MFGKKVTSLSLGGISVEAIYIDSPLAHFEVDKGGGETLAAGEADADDAAPKQVLSLKGPIPSEHVALTPE